MVSRRLAFFIPSSSSASRWSTLCRAVNVSITGCNPCFRAQASSAFSSRRRCSDTVPEQHGHAQTDPQVCKPEAGAPLLRVVDDIDAIGEEATAHMHSPVRELGSSFAAAR